MASTQSAYPWLHQTHSRLCSEEIALPANYTLGGVLVGLSGACLRKKKEGNEKSDFRINAVVYKLLSIPK